MERIEEVDYISKESGVVKIKQNDDDFLILDEFSAYKRAAVEIANTCPPNYKDIIHECVLQGWLRPVAYMRKSELIWSKLKND
mgnify:CR=1 FL=1